MLRGYVAHEQSLLACYHELARVVRICHTVDITGLLDLQRVSDRGLVLREGHNVDEAKDLADD